MQGVPGRLLVGELRSHMAHGQNTRNAKQKQYCDKFNKDFKKINKRMRLWGHRFFVDFSTTLFLLIYFTTSLFCCFCLKEKITTTWGKIVDVFTRVTRTATLGQVQSRGEDSGQRWEQSRVKTARTSAAQPRA